MPGLLEEEDTNRQREKREINPPQNKPLLSIITDIQELLSKVAILTT